MKNCKLRFMLFLGLLAVTSLVCLLFPLAMILIIFKPQKFQHFLFKLVNTLRLLDWLYKI